MEAAADFASFLPFFGHFFLARARDRFCRTFCPFSPCPAAFQFFRPGVSFSRGFAPEYTRNRSVMIASAEHRGTALHQYCPASSSTAGVGPEMPQPPTRFRRPYHCKGHRFLSTTFAFIVRYYAIAYRLGLCNLGKKRWEVVSISCHRFCQKPLFNGSEISKHIPYFDIYVEITSIFRYNQLTVNLCL